MRSAVITLHPERDIAHGPRQYRDIVEQQRRRKIYFQIETAALELISRLCRIHTYPLLRGRYGIAHAGIARGRMTHKAVSFSVYPHIPQHRLRLPRPMPGLLAV